jgi:ketosteroid isomerase-like protein
MRLYSCLTIALMGLLVGTASYSRTAQNPAADTAAVEAVVNAFYGAMKPADKAAAMALIAEDAMFVEGGRIETREQYEANHLPADIEFEQAVAGNRTSTKVTIDRDAAWVIATTEYHGKFENEPVNFVSAQLMLLTRQGSNWRIRSIHWSSRRL